jgi:hypothetical protein
MSAIELIVLVLATWRITNIMTEEDGPWDINRRIRRYFFAGEFNPTDPKFDRFTPAELDWWVQIPVMPTQGFFGKLLTCALCTSVWVGAGLGWPYLFFPHLTLFVALPFALSGASLVFGEVYGVMEPEENEEE